MQKQVKALEDRQKTEEEKQRKVTEGLQQQIQTMQKKLENAHKVFLPCT